MRRLKAIIEAWPWLSEADRWTIFHGLCLGRRIMRQWRRLEFMLPAVVIGRMKAEG